MVMFGSGALGFRGARKRLGLEGLPEAGGGLFGGWAFSHFGTRHFMFDD